MKDIHTINLKFLVLPLLLLCFHTTEAQTRIGYTSVEMILPRMPEYPGYEKDVKTFQQRLDVEMENSVKNARNRLAEYQDDMGLSALREEMDRLEGKRREKAKMNEEKLAQYRMERIRPLQEKMQTAINEVAKEGGFTFILNNTLGDGIASILFGIEKDDITPALCKKLGIRLP